MWISCDFPIKTEGHNSGLTNTHVDFTIKDSKMKMQLAKISSPGTSGRQQFAMQEDPLSFKKVYFGKVMPPKFGFWRTGHGDMKIHRVPSIAKSYGWCNHYPHTCRMTGEWDACGCITLWQFHRVEWNWPMPIERFTVFKMVKTHCYWMLLIIDQRVHRHISTYIPMNIPSKTTRFEGILPPYANHPQQVPLLQLSQTYPPPMPRLDVIGA